MEARLYLIHKGNSVAKLATPVFISFASGFLELSGESNKFNKMFWVIVVWTLIYTFDICWTFLNSEIILD